MPATAALAEKIGSQFILSHEERAAIASLPSRLVSVADGERIHRVGDRPDAAFVVVDGVVCSCRDIEDGKRQIMSFYLRGEMPDIRVLLLGVMDCDAVAVGPARVGFIDHADLRRLCDRFPRVARAFWRSTLVIASIYREWIVNIGHRSALARIAHLFCEMMARMESAGLSDGRTADLPFTQAHLSAATGLSTVHVNRTLQELRRRELVVFGGGRLVIPDRAALAAVAHFAAGYLYLPDPVAEPA